MSSLIFRNVLPLLILSLSLGVWRSSILAENTSNEDLGATTSGSAAPTNEEVDALDSWYFSGATSGSSSGQKTILGSSGGEKGASSSSAAASGALKHSSSQVHRARGKELDDPFVPDGVVLRKAKQAEVSAAKKIIRKRQKDDKSIIEKYQPPDPRGLSEITLCLANLNNYGSAADMEATLRRKKGPTRTKKRASFLRAVQASNCDAIVLLGVIGKTETSAREALLELVREVSKVTKKEDARVWDGVLEKGGHRLIYNALLYQPSRVEVVGQKSHGEIILPQFEPFVHDKFPRAPWELHLRAKHGNNAAEKQILLLVFHLQKKLEGIENVAFRMQLAEGVRQILETFFGRVSNDTLLVMMGDRMSGAHSPEALILEGRHHLVDFKKGGPCTFDKDGAITCENVEKRPRAFLGLVSSPYGKLRDRKYSLNERMQYSVEMYLRSVDLAAAQMDLKHPLQNNVTLLPLQNGLPKSPLVCLELNW